MRLLLDTHTFIWMIDRPERLPPTAAGALLAASNELILSHASIWEMQVKYGAGRLSLSLAPLMLARREEAVGAITLLPITLDHVARLAELPAVHRDPFDRMLVSQARREGLTLVTADGDIPKYPVPTLWS